MPVHPARLRFLPFVLKAITVVALAVALGTLVSAPIRFSQRQGDPAVGGTLDSFEDDGDDPTVLLEGGKVLPVDPSGRPFYDFVLAIFSGDDDDYRAVQKRDALREIYGKYGGWASVPDGPLVYKYSIKVLFVVGYAAAPDDGELVGDVLYVRCPRGYHHIVEKTKRMVSVTKHMRFRYLVKGDDDTFVCFDRLARYLHSLPEEAKSRVYGGIPTACGLDRNAMVGRVIKDPSHKWFDGKYVNHTMAGLDCYPVYMQGALYVLAYHLADFLQKGQNHLVTFTNEDVTMGTWLLGVDRVVVPFNSLGYARLWDCSCARVGFRIGVDVNAFYHNCKQVEQLKRCFERTKNIVC